MKFRSKLIVVLGLAFGLGACAGPTEFDVKVPAPALPQVTTLPPTMTNVVEVVDAKKLDAAVSPVTSLCRGLVYRLAYSEEATKAIEGVLSRLSVGTPPAPRSFVVNVDDFNVRSMCLFTAAFEARADVEVRLVLEARDRQGGGPWRGASEFYFENPEPTSDGTKPLLKAIPEQVRKALTEALADLAESIRNGVAS